MRGPRWVFAGLVGLSMLVAFDVSRTVHAGTRACLGTSPTEIGTRGDDVLRGTPGDDVLLGRGGDDRLIGGQGDDRICGGPGSDLGRGGAGMDALAGQRGSDRLFGGSGDDDLKGGRGFDVLDGGLGTDGCALGESLTHCEPAGSRFSCTQVIGFSQTTAWFVAMEEQTAVHDGTWELLSHAGAEISAWAQVDHSFWSEPIRSACATGSLHPDRVILTISGDEGTDWAARIAEAVDATRVHYPNVRSIRLQPVVGGPDHQLCPTDGGYVRASFNHPLIHQTILDLVGVVDATIGADPLVRDCSDYRDGQGHLTSDGSAYQGRKIGVFYMSGG